MPQDIVLCRTLFNDVLKATSCRPWQLDNDFGWFLSPTCSDKTLRCSAYFCGRLECVQPCTALLSISLAPSQGCRSSSAAQACLAQVHFDCLYKGIDVASSRSARLLGGNRTIAEVHTFCSCPPILGITCLNVLGERFPMQASCILLCKRSCCGKRACSAEPIQCACAMHQAFAWSLAMQVAIRMRSLAQSLGLLCCSPYIPSFKPIAAVGRRLRSLEATHILSNGWLFAGMQFLVAYCCVFIQHDACTFV